MFNLLDKVALVTGAQRSMGKAYALALASQGAKVILTDKEEGGCDAIAAEITSQGGEAFCLALDVSNKKQIELVFDKVARDFKQLDILINCTGISKAKPALELTEQEWDETININLKGQFFCAQRAAKEMSKNKWGRIVNISSIATGETVVHSGPAHSSASKGGMISMTETLAEEWAPLGINVNAIVLGMITTPRIEGLHITKEQKKAILAQIPLRRIGKPEEVAAAVVFLASTEASYITGATLFVDGGWLVTKIKNKYSVSKAKHV